MASKFPVAVLRRICSSDAGYKCIQLDCNEVSIGRSKENTYSIADLLVSRKHAVFRLNKDQWTIESVGMNGVSVNHVIAPKHQQIPIQHMDTIEFGAGNKFVYAFRVQSSTTEVSEEPVAKKMRLPLVNRNYPSLKDSPEAFHSWLRSKKNLEKTLEEESDHLDAKLDQQKSIKDKLVLEQEKLNAHFDIVKAQLELKFSEEKKELEDKVERGEMEKNELQREKEDVEQRMSVSLQEFQAECEKKKLEFEESVERANLEKKKLIEQKELVVQQLIQEKNVLQERLEEESRLKEETMSELVGIKQSHRSLEQELEEARRKMEEETKQFQRKGSEDELRLRQMQQELTEREAQLRAKEKEIEEIQSRAAIGLEMYETIQILHQGQEIQNRGNIVVVMDDGQTYNQPNLTEQELERVREELRVQKELNDQQASNKSSSNLDIVGEMEYILENELQCGICSELMVFATNLNCMHNFCQYCVGEWKKNKAECPICRAPITTEGRNLVVDNIIDAMVNKFSEEVKSRRKELVKQRQIVNRLSTEKNPSENIRSDQHVTLGAANIRQAPGRSRRIAGRSVSNAGLPNLNARAGVPFPPAVAAAAGLARAGSTSHPRARVSVAQQPSQAVRPPPPVAIRPLPVPVQLPIRGTMNRSTAPAQTFPNPQPAGPVIVSATEEVVILSSGSESEQVADFLNRRRQRKRK